MIKGNIIVIVSLFFIGACKQDSKKINTSEEAPRRSLMTNSLMIAGSETMRPIMEMSIPDYEKKSGEKINYLGGGSNVGLIALWQNEVDIAVCSRELTNDELQGRKLKQTKVALDGLSIITNVGNNVSKLTKEQVAKIYEGKITNWKELGGDDLKIIPYSRNISSGTYSFFKLTILDGESYSRDDIKLADNYQVINEVMENKGAIGYVGFAYNLKKVKPVELSLDEGKSYVFPNMENILSNEYPLSRPLYCIYFSSDSAKVNSYLSYLLSDEGQKLILLSGFVPIKAK